MSEESKLNAAATAIPVTFGIDQGVVDRLLGPKGKAVLQKTIEQAQEVVRIQGWPAKRIEVDYDQSEEDEEWETLTVTAVLKEPVQEPLKKLNDYIVQMSLMRRDRLSPPEREVVYGRIFYGLKTE